MWRTALALLAFTACSRGEAPQRPTAAEAQAPVIGGERPGEWPSYFQWLSGDANGRAFLSFQPAESDNVQITFECVAGSNSITAEAFDPRRQGAELVLSSGEARGEFAARPITDPTGDFFGDAVRSHADIAITEPVLAAFRQSGVLSSGDPPVAYRAASSEELAGIQRFFALCERRWD